MDSLNGNEPDLRNGPQALTVYCPLRLRIKKAHREAIATNLFSLRGLVLRYDSGAVREGLKESFDDASIWHDSSKNVATQSFTQLKSHSQLPSAIAQEFVFGVTSGSSNLKHNHSQSMSKWKNENSCLIVVSAVR
jgi:hypothetical protein